MSSCLSLAHGGIVPRVGSNPGPSMPKRILIGLVALVALSGCAAKVSPREAKPKEPGRVRVVASSKPMRPRPTVVVAGRTLHLAYAEVGLDGKILNEYIDGRETVSNWTMLFAVRHVPGISKPDEAVAQWKAYLKGVVTPGLNLVEADGSTEDDRQFTLAIRPVGDRYLELNAARFVRAPDGKTVIFYQGAIRFNPSRELSVDPYLRFADVQSSVALATVQAIPPEKL